MVAEETLKIEYLSGVFLPNANGFVRRKKKPAKTRNKNDCARTGLGEIRLVPLETTGL